MNGVGGWGEINVEAEVIVKIYTDGVLQHVSDPLTITGISHRVEFLQYAEYAAYAECAEYLAFRKFHVQGSK